MNVTVFEHRVFKEVIKVNKTIGVGPNPHQKKKLEHRKHRAEDDHARTQREDRYLQARERGEASLADTLTLAF